MHIGKVEQHIMIRVYLKENYGEIVANGPIRVAEIDKQGRPFVNCTPVEAQALQLMKMVETSFVKKMVIPHPPLGGIGVNSESFFHSIERDIGIDAPPVEEVVVEDLDVERDSVDAPPVMEEVDELEEEVEVASLIKNPDPVSQLGLPSNINKVLIDAGYDSVESLVGVDVSTLFQIRGIGKVTAIKIHSLVAER